jgi:hypothetical protein
LRGGVEKRAEREGRKVAAREGSGHCSIKADVVNGA